MIKTIPHAATKPRTRKPRPRRTADELKAVSAHIHYEFAMCLLTAEALRHGGMSQVFKNALINSMTIHARALIHFFLPKEPRSDDVLAQDFYPNQAEWERERGLFPAALSDVHARVAKEIAHLSYDRLLVTPDKKGWHAPKIKLAIEDVGQRFINSVDHAKLDPKWLKADPTTL